MLEIWVAALALLQVQLGILTVAEYLHFPSISISKNRLKAVFCIKTMLNFPVSGHSLELRTKNRSIVLFEFKVAQVFFNLAVRYLLYLIFIVSHFKCTLVFAQSMTTYLPHIYRPVHFLLNFIR